jgi:hypothetical protein
LSKAMRPHENKLVEVCKVSGEAAAQILKGKLESNDIPVVLTSLAAPSVHVFILDGLGEYHIWVPASLAEEARKLIEEDEDV